MATPTPLPSSFVAAQVLTAAEMNDLRGAFRVLQVVSTTKTDTYTGNNSTFTTITGLTATITPSSTSSKIFVIAQVSAAVDTAASTGYLRLIRDSTAIAVGATAGNRVLSTCQLFGTPVGHILSTLDSPNSTSAIVYAVQETRSNQSATIAVNRGIDDSDTAQRGRFSSTITVMEISA